MAWQRQQTTSGGNLFGIRERAIDLLFTLHKRTSDRVHGRQRDPGNGGKVENRRALVFRDVNEPKCGEQRQRRHNEHACRRREKLTGSIA